MPYTGNRHGPIHPDEIPAILWDYNKRLNELEKTVPNLISRLETNTEIVVELKDIVIQGNKDAMDFMKSVIGHEQNMDKLKHQVKMDMQKAEMEMKQKAAQAEDDFRRQKEAWERKQTAEREKFLRQQQAENRAAVRQVVTKVLLIAAPVLTAVVTAIVKAIDAWPW